MTAVIIDTETTGKDDPEPIEVATIAVVSLEPFEIARSECERFLPSRPIALGAMATHGIVRSDLEGCRPASSYALPDGVEYVIGHHVDFDVSAIGNPPVKAIDTCAIARHLWPHFDSHSLFACLFALAEPYARLHCRTAHGALADVYACAELLREIVTQRQVGTFEELYALSERARVPETWPFGKFKGRPLAEADYSYVAWVLTKMENVDPYLRRALQERFRGGIGRAG